ncbi:MAG: hypothetical protein BWY63_01652 [Chloroflexi bacterium ADurb.Bin360]|nr:MAG: hypothetical protein BWY63_01652 [Chloroflexi bacterium ADurb.Bin360]
MEEGVEVGEEVFGAESCGLCVWGCGLDGDEREAEGFFHRFDKLRRQVGHAVTVGGVGRPEGEGSGVEEGGGGFVGVDVEGGNMRIINRRNSPLISYCISHKKIVYCSCSASTNSNDANIVSTDEIIPYFLDWTPNHIY